MPIAPDEFAYVWYYPIRLRIREQFRTLSEDEADDLVQGIFEKIAENGWRRLAAWRGLDSDEGPELAGYLYTIARNYVLDYLGQQRARRSQQDKCTQLRHDDRYEIDHDLPGCLSGASTGSPTGTERLSLCDSTMS